MISNLEFPAGALGASGLITCQGYDVPLWVKLYQMPWAATKIPWPSFGREKCAVQWLNSYSILTKFMCNHVSEFYIFSRAMGGVNRKNYPVITPWTAFVAQDDFL